MMHLAVSPLFDPQTIRRQEDCPPQSWWFLPEIEDEQSHFV
jgi:hypothetical protein